MEPLKRPLLAAKAEPSDLAKIRYPVLASPKLDGIRVVCHQELGPVTRKFKPVPNRHIRTVLSHPRFAGLDGEVVTYTAGVGRDDFNTIQSKVMSQGGEPIFRLIAFDYYLLDEPYNLRVHIVATGWQNDEIVVPLEHKLIASQEELAAYSEKCIKDGYEGICFRDPHGKYKAGRSTLREQILVKYKTFADAEGKVVAFQELFRNTNEQKRDELGLAKRSSEKAGMIGANTLGALVLETVWGPLFVGSGFDMATRDEIWANREKYMGRTVTFTYQPYGMQEKPRFPIFKGFRED